MPYLIILILQVFCVLHVLNQRKERWWIWLIILVPAIGSIVYIVSEVFRVRDLNNVQREFTQMVNPGSKIKELEKRLAFADTHQNKVALADAYLTTERVEEAIDLYESSLDGLFKDDPHVFAQLVSAYYQICDYEKAIAKARFVLKNKDFQTSRTRLHYALALEKSGNFEAAEKELEAMDTPYAGYENRVAYGQFLIRNHQPEKAISVFE